MLVPCMNCYTAVRVIDDAEETSTLVGDKSEFWPAKYTCISCSAACEGILESDTDAEVLSKFKVRDLTAPELYAALMGLGTPDEMQCDATTVNELFSQKKVKKVHGRNLPNTTRFLLEDIEMEDGTKLYFGAGPAGAVVYRITRPVSYTNKVLEDG